MNAIEPHEPIPNPDCNFAAAEWKRLIFEGERHMMDGDYQNARFAYLAALSFAKWFAPAHPFWNKTLANLRYLYINYVCSRAASVEELYAATVPEWETALGENHFFIALWLEKCVKSAKDAEQYALAERLWRKMLACWDAAPYITPSARQLRRLPILHGIGRACFAQGKYADASEYFSLGLKITDPMALRSDPRLVVYLEDAAATARQQGDFKMETRYTERALQIRRYNPSFFAKADRRSRDERDAVQPSRDH